MLDKLLMALVPACICFGPHFMIMGTGQSISNIEYFGCVQVMLALMWMYFRIMRQDKEIAALRKQLAPDHTTIQSSN
jgi:hypothetical protein